MVKNRWGSNFFSWNSDLNPCLESMTHGVCITVPYSPGEANSELYSDHVAFYCINWKEHSAAKAANLIELFASLLKQHCFLVFPRGLLCQLPSLTMWCSSVFVICVFVLSFHAILCQIVLFPFHLWNTYLLRETQQTREWFEGKLPTAVSTYLIYDSCT